MKSQPIQLDKNSIGLIILLLMVVLAGTGLFWLRQISSANMPSDLPDILSGISQANAKSSKAIKALNLKALENSELMLLNEIIVPTFMPTKGNINPFQKPLQAGLITATSTQ